MKKLLLTALCGSVALGAFAQRAEKGVMFTQTTPMTVGETPSYKPADMGDVYRLLKINKAVAERAAAKGTGAGGQRWYDHFAMMSAFNNNIFSTNANTFVWGMWFDSTVTQYFTASGSTPAGYRRVNWSSCEQFVDPVTSKMFNDISFANEIIIKPYNSYKIDSISIRGAYVRMSSRPAGIVDTLVISVAPQEGGHYYVAKQNPDYGSKVANYTTKDTVRFCAPLVVDSVNRAVFPASTLPSGTARAYWKEPLTAADGDTALANGSFTTREYTIAVPGGGLTVPAGSRFAVAVTFKSGDTWTKNVDSLNKFHRFMPVSGFINNSYMQYIRESHNDLSMSGMMFSWDSSLYAPSGLIEIWNQPTMSYEHHNIAAHVVCADCDKVSVDDVQSNIERINAYPNPAAQVVVLPFVLKNSADVKVTMSNLFGQVVKEKEYKNVLVGSADFNVSDLVNGVYMYTIEVNGERKSGRVTVAH